MALKHYHAEVVRFVIESIFDERLAGEERVLTAEDTLARIAQRANEKFCRHKATIQTRDIQRIYNTYHRRQEAVKRKFITEHLKLET